MLLNRYDVKNCTSDLYRKADWFVKKVLLNVKIMVYLNIVCYQMIRTILSSKDNRQKFYSILIIVDKFPYLAALGGLYLLFRISQDYHGNKFMGFGYF